MNKYLRYALPMALGTLVMAGCKDDDKVEVGQWNSSADYAVVSFAEQGVSVELDPAEETTYTLHMTRRNPELSAKLDAELDKLNEQIEAEKKATEEKLKAKGLTDEQVAEIQKQYQDAVAALKAQYAEFDESNCMANLPEIEVPITITNGTGDVFTISNAKFEQGDWEGEYTISFPNAEVGTTYEVQYAVTDPRFVSYYSEGAATSFSVTRVKWVSIGTADFHDYFWFEGNNPVEVLMKDGDNTQFRIMDPFNKMAAPYKSTTSSEYVQLTLLKKGDKLEGVTITEEDLVYFTPIATGYIHPEYNAHIICWHPADLYSTPNESMYLASHVLGYTTVTVEGKEYKVPGAINLAPYFYMSGVGGWNQTTEDPCIRIVMDGFKLTYEADLFNEDDFEWKEVYTGEFTSKQMGFTNDEVTLYKGNCVATQDRADSTFTAKYGVPYVIEAPYAADYDIYFFVKDGRIQMPKDYDDDLGLQPTGLEAAGMPIYVKINGSSSSFTEKSVTLNLTFQAERKYRDENGRTQYEYITLDTNNEQLANIIWNEAGSGLFTYDFFSQNDDYTPWTDPEPYKLLQREDVPNSFKIPDWGMGVNFAFTWNQTTNACVVEDQFSGYTHSTYGEVYIVEGALYDEEEYGEATSYFDPETKTFHFFPVYYVEAGSFGQTEEIFQLTGDGASVKHKATRVINITAKPKKVNTKITKIWNTKKMSKPAKSKKDQKALKQFSNQLFAK